MRSAVADVVAGWYPDPAGGPAARWWDGHQWTNHLQPAQPPSQGYAAAPYGGAPHQAWSPVSAPAAPQQFPQYSNGYAQLPQQFGAQPTGSVFQRNRYTAISVGVAALYAIFAIAVHIVFIGIVPILFCVRAFRAREQYRVVAAIAAALAVIFSLAMLAH